MAKKQTKAERLESEERDAVLDTARQVARTGGPPPGTDKVVLMVRLLTAMRGDYGPAEKEAIAGAVKVLGRA